MQNTAFERARVQKHLVKCRFILTNVHKHLVKCRFIRTNFKKHIVKCQFIKTNFNKHLVKLRDLSTNFKKHLVKLTSKLTNLRKHLAKLQLFPQACLKGFLNCLCEMKGIVQVGTHQSSRGLRAYVGRAQNYIGCSVRDVVQFQELTIAKYGLRASTSSKTPRKVSIYFDKCP